MGNNASEIRRIDQLGRIVLPKTIREALEIGEGDALAVSLENGKIVMEVREKACIFCGSTEDLFDFKGKTICKACKNELK